MSEITKPGGEWVWDLQIGQTSLIATELFLPLSQFSGWFVDPHAETAVRNLPALVGQNEVAEYRLHTYDFGVDFGRQFGNWGEIRTGIIREHGHSRVTIGDLNDPNLPTQAEQDFAVRDYFARFSYDRLDDVNFPHRGQQATLQWSGERNASGADVVTDQITLNYIAAHSFGRDSVVFSTSLGTTLESKVTTDPRLLFPLGGFFNLSGLYRQIGRGGPGYLDVPTYLGVSFEMGNVWQQLRDASFGNTHKDASVFLGMDTFLGPVYLATGFDKQGGQAFYLFLGRTFGQPAGPGPGR
jgi:NTE family protein